MKDGLRPGAEATVTITVTPEMVATFEELGSVHPPVLHLVDGPAHGTCLPQNHPAIPGSRRRRGRVQRQCDATKRGSSTWPRWNGVTTGTSDPLIASLQLLEGQIDSGSHGVVIAGTTGEPSALSLEEREHLCEVAVRTLRRPPGAAGVHTGVEWRPAVSTALREHDIGFAFEAGYSGNRFLVPAATTGQGRLSASRRPSRRG